MSVMLKTELPAKDAFFSILHNEHISDVDYAHAQHVWKAFNCQTLGDYHDIYLRTDVMLLADIFENFRNISLESYKLDPAHYFTAPGLAWDAMLKLTGVRLELIDDIDQYLMIESGLRGGISMISNKYAKANNPYVSEYDPDRPSNYIMYYDANNLYGWSICRYLPEREFDWMTDQQLANFDVTQVPDDSDTGYILEVDLEYPEELHDSHSDYPLAPEKKQVDDEELSPYSLELKAKLGIKGHATEKLVPNLNNKSRYVLHYQNLKLYLSLGMKLVKIHRAIEFHQSPWLKPYIALNTEKRKHAKNEFEKSFYKLLNNAVYGKFLQNNRKHIEVELVHTEKRLKKVVSKTNFHAFKIFNKDLTGVHLRKTKVYLNKPMYVGFAIVDMSKILMYDFHYNFIKQKYGEKAKLLFTDTDSLYYDIETNDIYHDSLQQSHLFDTSDYPKDHILYSDRNKKVLRKMKDETNGIPITEFVGLRSKMYSMTYGQTENKTAKGISCATTRNELRHSMYRSCLFDETIFSNKMKSIRSFPHNIYSIEINKISLSPYDDKRFVLGNKCDTLAHGHYAIQYANL